MNLIAIFKGLFSGKPIGNILLILLLGTFAFFGWSYSNRGNKVEKLEAETARLRNELGDERHRSDSLLRKSNDLIYRVSEDSLNNQRMTREFQLIIKQLREQKLNADKEREQALAGILCYKVNLFGKKKLVNCDEL